LPISELLDKNARGESPRAETAVSESEIRARREIHIKDNRLGIARKNNKEASSRMINDQTASKGYGASISRAKCADIKGLPPSLNENVTWVSLTLFIPLDLLVNTANAECRNIDVGLVMRTLGCIQSQLDVMVANCWMGELATLRTKNDRSFIVWLRIVSS
jgi:hypothetical protein